MTRRRGRPTAAEYHGFSDIGEIIAAGSAKTKRQQAAHFYASCVFGILSEAASDIPHLDGIFRIVDEAGGKAVYQRTEIIEQLGRLYQQDGADEAEIIEAATAAANLYHGGATVKEIKQALVRYRLKRKGATE